jgi:hypothetical protein
MDRYLPAGATHHDLLREYHRTTGGVWYHPGDHPALDGYIRWGVLADGRPWLSSSIRPAMGEWVFPDTEEGEIATADAVRELLSTRPDGRWEKRPVTPEGLGHPKGN